MVKFRLWVNIKNMKKVDYFERTYYKVIDFETKKTVYEKTYTSQMCRNLGIGTHHITRAMKNKKGYYLNKKTNKKYIFEKLENEII